MSIRNMILIMLLITTTTLQATELQANELPEMYTKNQIGFLQTFPLYKTTIADVIATYGPPQMRIDGAVKDREIWTYYRKSTVYVIHFALGRVYNVIITNTGYHWLGRDLPSAYALQGGLNEISRR